MESVASLARRTNWGLLARLIASNHNCHLGRKGGDDGERIFKDIHFAVMVKIRGRRGRSGILEARPSIMAFLA
jgi:hypothetical protein